MTVRNSHKNGGNEGVSPTDREKARELMRALNICQPYNPEGDEQDFRIIASALSEARKDAIEECDKRWGSAVAEWSATVSSHPGCDIAEAIIKRALKGTP